MRASVRQDDMSKKREYEPRHASGNVAEWRGIGTYAPRHAVAKRRAEAVEAVLAGDVK